MIKTNSLTTKEKIKLLHYIKGKYCIADMDTYSLVENAPKEDPDATHYYISSVLNIDFDEFYDDPITTEKSKLIDTNDSPWFIGDKLVETLHKHVKSVEVKVDESLIDKTDQELLEVYSRFNHEVHDKFVALDSMAQKVEYVPTGITCNGKELYEKVVEDATVW